MPSISPQAERGAFVPTNYMLEIARIQRVDVTGDEFKRLIVKLYQNLGNIAKNLNKKETGYYPLQEFVTGQQYFPDPNLSSLTSQAPVFRQTFRKVIDFGSLPNAATKSVLHNLTITDDFIFTRIYATASKPTAAYSFIPIPFASSTAADIISISIDGTNVNITTASNKTTYTVCYVTIEFLKQ